MFSKVKICFLMITILALLLVPACGGGDDEDNTSTPTATAAPTATATPTATTTPTLSKEPVKIAILNVWTGPAALSGTYFADLIIKVVEKQVEERGGILGGRPLQIKKYDTQGTVAGAVSAATKAVVQDGVSVLAFGGLGGTENTAIAEVACDHNAFFVSSAPTVDTPELKCMVEGTVSIESVMDSVPFVATDQLQPKPQTAAILDMEQAGVDLMIGKWKSKLESAGIKIVSEQRLTPGTVDFSPYLTKIKYADPDVLILYMTTADYMGVANQIMALGGWGDIQVIAEPTAVTAAKMPGATGWLSVAPWYPELDNPESIKYIQDFKAVNGRAPDYSHIYFYLSFWTAIHAIELAGTADDGGAIAKAARSGKLGFDTPMGPVHFNADGKSDIKMRTIRIEKGGKLVPFQ